MDKLQDVLLREMPHVISRAVFVLEKSSRECYVISLSKITCLNFKNKLNNIDLHK